MRILIVANLYPSAAHPAFGTFVAAHASALIRAGADVTVVAISDARTHENLIGKYVGLAFQAIRTALSARLARRRFDIVEAHIAYPTGVPAALVAFLGGSKLVLYAHGSDVTTVARRSRAHTALARFVFRRASLVVANSSHTKALVDRLGRPPRPTLVISPGIVLPDPLRPQPLRRSGILFVGRLIRDKGIFELIEALTHVGTELDAALTVVGDGPERDALERLAASLRVRAAFLGPIPPSALGDLYDAAAVVAMPSTYDEPLGLVALEAMAHGAVLVSTRRGGLAEIIRDGVNAIAIETVDGPTLGAALRRGIEASRTGEGDALRTSALAAANLHDVDKSAIEVLRAYASLV